MNMRTAQIQQVHFIAHVKRITAETVKHVLLIREQASCVKVFLRMQFGNTVSKCNTDMERFKLVTRNNWNL